MTLSILIGLTIAVLGCALHRMAGGGHPFKFLGTQGARILFLAAPLALMVFALSYFSVVTAPVWLPLAVLAAALLGRVAVPHGAGQYLDVPWSGRAGDDYPLVARGERLGYLLSAAVTRYWLLALALFAVSPVAIFLPILAVGYPLAYLVGLWLDKRGWVFRRWITFSCEWAEFLFGGWLFGTLYVVLLLL